MKKEHGILHELVWLAAAILISFVVVRLNEEAPADCPNIAIQTGIPSTRSQDTKQLERGTRHTSHWNKTQEYSRSRRADTNFSGAPTSRGPEKSWAKMISANQPDSMVLHSLGLKPYVISNWKKYLRAGGKVRDTMDIKKIYGMTPEQWKRLRNSVKFEKVQPPEVKAKLRLSVNDAAPEEWKQLRGIGDVLSKRIVKFRDQLGGFHRIDQVKETYGISDSLFQAIRPFLAVEGPLKKVPINSATKEELAMHPYISWKEAKVIIKYRDHHGPFTHVNQLLQTQIIEQAWIDRLSPYLKLEEPFLSAE